MPLDLTHRSCRRRRDELSGEEVHGRAADETRHEQIGRAVVQRLRRVELLQHAVPHDGDAVAHGHGLDLVVGHVDGGRLQSLVQLDEARSRFDAQLGVEVDSGSSIRNTCGSRTMARPSATRWRWPPDSCLGLRCSRFAGRGSRPLP